VLDVLFLRAGGFSWRPSDKFNVIFCEKYDFFQLCNFTILVIKSLIRIRMELDCWIRIRIETNADPQHWFMVMHLNGKGEGLNIKKG
jgi:hypothetical protein